MTDPDAALNGNKSEHLPNEIFKEDSKECPSCLLTQILDNKFCEKCGHNFSAKMKNIQLKIRNNFKKTEIKIDKSNIPFFIRDARFFIVLIAFITIGYYGYVFISDMPNDRFNSMPSLLNLIMKNKPSYVFIFLTSVYLILFFWSFRNPLSALVICFVFYFIETWIIMYIGGWVSIPFVLLKLFILFLFIGSIKMQIKFKNLKLKF